MFIRKKHIIMIYKNEVLPVITAELFAVVHDEKTKKNCKRT